MKLHVSLPAVLLLSVSSVSAQPAKNVILMISDGAGATTWQAANQWQFGADAGTAPEFRQRWENDFDLHWMTTYPGHTQAVAPSLTGGAVLPISLFDGFTYPEFGSYNPAQAWDDTPAIVNLVDNNGRLGRGDPVTLLPNPVLPPSLLPLAQLAASGFEIISTPGFAAYDYLVTRNVTDSAAAGTALASGVKSYNSSINFDLNENPVPFITQAIVAKGKSAGVVTTKPFTDATPSAFGTQSPSRQEEEFISNSMITNGLLSVIISPGHPEFGSGGTPRTPDYEVVSETNLQALRNGFDGWTFVDDTADLVAISEGTTPAPQRLFGLVPVSSSLHSRDTSARTNAFDPRLFDDANPNGSVPFVMPDLDVLSMAAINTLKQDEDGFFLMIEGASVDSAAHGNDLPRMLEEQLSFNRAVDRVISWVETESSWDETLVIITTDHANALLLGPDSETVFMQPPVASGVGELPNAIWWSTNHTNELVPLWAFGVGSDRFADLTDGVDPVRGDYIDNTDVHAVVSAVMINSFNPDITTDNTNPGDAGYLVPDGVVTIRDLTTFVELWIADEVSEADITTDEAMPGDSAYFLPDGVVTATDLSSFVEVWANGNQ
ncbi:MAG: alkaline phosphatase [Planctomycetota bacterium]